MKTRFDSIVKVKKQKLDQAQMALLKQRDKQRVLEERIKRLNEDIISVKIPKKGSFMQMQHNRQMLSILRRQKEILANELVIVMQNVAHCQKLYEFANKEYEKMLYLKDEEIANKIKKMQKQAQKDIDEIAVQLFARRMNK